MTGGGVRGTGEDARNGRGHGGTDVVDFGTGCYFQSVPKKSLGTG